MIGDVVVQIIEEARICTIGVFSLSSDLSAKEKIQMVNEISGRINRASNLLSGHLSRLTLEDSKENKEHVRRIKREIRTILTQLSNFGVYCSKSTKNEIERLSSMGAYFTMFQSIRTFHSKRPSIDYWASLVLTLRTGIDVTKWPLELEGGVKIKIKNFVEAYLKGKTKRPV